MGPRQKASLAFRLRVVLLSAAVLTVLLAFSLLYKKGWQASGDPCSPPLTHCPCQEAATYNTKRQLPGQQTPADAAAASSQPGKLAQQVVAAGIQVLILTEGEVSDGTKDAPSPVPCSFQGLPLSCRYGGVESGMRWEAADALWFHLPHVDSPAALPPRAFPGQAFIAMSMESSVNYPQLDDPFFMRHFDYKMTYRPTSDVPLIYPPFDIRAANEAALPGFHQRQAAVVYINSNCETHTRRHELVEALFFKYGLPLVAPGKCMHNTKEPPTGNRGHEVKVALQSKYRVCIAMENSLAADYVTEKLWDALAAGCVPIYYGAPNARADFLPAHDSVIMVDDFRDLAALAREVWHVLEDEAVFKKYTAWRSVPFEQLSAGYRRLVASALSSKLPQQKCRMCQLLAAHKLQQLEAA